MAAGAGHVDIVKCLVENGAKVNAKTCVSFEIYNIIRLPKEIKEYTSVLTKIVHEVDGVFQEKQIVFL